MKTGTAGWIQKHERLMTGAYVFLFVLLIAAPALLLKISDGRDDGTALQSGSSSPLVFLPESAVSEKSAEIYEWIKLRNPFQRLMPDSMFGFADIVPAYGPRKVTQPGDSTIPPLPVEKRQLIGTAGLEVAGRYGDVQLQKQLAHIDVDFPVRKKLETQQGAFWFNDSGRILKNAPVIALDAIMLAIGAGPRNQKIGKTRLYLEALKAAEPVRIVVRESCGNTELDRYAAAAMREHLMKVSLPGANPVLPAEGIVLDVLWKLPRN